MKQFEQVINNAFKRRVNVDWLRDTNFDKKFHTDIVLPDGSRMTMDSWTDEQDVIEGEFGEKIRLELQRYYSTAHARWIDDDENKKLYEKMKGWSKDSAK